MDLFEELSWKVSDVSTLDIGTNFINDEIIEQSYVFQNNFVPLDSIILPNKKSNEKNSKTLYQRTSKLNFTQQRQCLQALQLLESDRSLSSLSPKEQQLINIYNNLKCVINEENKEFLKYIENLWTNNKKPTVLHKKLRDFAIGKRKQNLDTIRNYPEFYTEYTMIPLSRNKSSIELIHEGVLLELGVVGKLYMPNVAKNDNMYINKLPSLKPDDVDEYIKSPVSKDIHAEYLAKQTACNIVISSSGLKSIIDNFGPDFNASWNIPVVVKEHVSNGRKFNVVYVDKTLPNRNVTLHDLSYNTRKILLKRIMCSEVAHCFVTPKFIIDNYDAHRETTTNNAETIETKQNTNNPDTKLPVTQTNDDSNKTGQCISPKRQETIDVASNMETNGSDIEIIKNNTEIITTKQNTNNPDTKLPVAQTNDDSKTDQCSTPKRRKTIDVESPTVINNSTIETNDSNTPVKQKLKTTEVISPMTSELSDGEIVDSDSSHMSKTNESSILKKQAPVEINDISTEKNESNLLKTQTLKKQKNKIETKSTMKGLSSKYLTRSAVKKINESSSSDLKEPELKEMKCTKELFTGAESENEYETNEIKSPNRKSARHKKKKNVSGNQNVNYRLWKLKTQNEENLLMKNLTEKKEIKLIIRSKTDAYQIAEQGQYLATNVVPKLEYQMDHGGQMLTKSELLRQWTTLYFRPFSDLVRARIYPKSNKYVRIDHISLNKVTNECLKYYNFNPKENLNILFNVLSNMTDMIPGKYILRHTAKNGPFASLMKSSPETCPKAFNLYDFYKPENCNIIDFSHWSPIDTTLILPHHVKNGIMPGMFPPSNFALGNKKKRQAKRKNKRKVYVDADGEIKD